MAATVPLPRMVGGKPERPRGPDGILVAAASDLVVEGNCPYFLAS